MPNMMLNPLAWPSVLTNVPMVVPKAAAARADASRMTNKRKRIISPAQFHHQDSKTDQQQHLHESHHHLP